jgi:sulfoxide reductase catalytic subunit YedY
MRPDWHLPEAAATPEPVYLDRRRLLAAMGLGAAGLVAGGALGVLGGVPLWGEERRPKVPAKPGGNEDWYEGLTIERNPAYTVPERDLTSEQLATTYNNFYEFTTDKGRVHELVGSFIVDPWTIRVEGEVEEPLTLDVEKLIASQGVEERVYRFRCVEAWAMTVPWSGIPMKKLIDLCKPKAEARYARFWSFLRPEQAIGQKLDAHYPWPYYEGFDIDELVNPLSLLTTGIYGKPLPRQNGAPVRVIMPWKYGLKCIKSIVRIEFTRERPPTFWNDLAPSEYSYHSNVEPDVPHPRWSQASERLIETGERVPTRLYNGYAEHVAHLYDGKR